MFALLFAPLMASIFRKPKSPYFFAAYRGPNGERLQRTTKEKNRSSAMRIAIEFEAAASKGRSRTLTEANARRVISEILEKSTGEGIQFHSCREWFTEWCAGKNGAVTDKSMEKYVQVTNAFLGNLGERAALSLAAISNKDIRQFRDTLRAEGRTAGTVNQIIRKVLSVPFASALRLGYITVNPCAGVDPLRDEGESQRDVFTIEQVSALVQAAEGDWKGAILCGYFTGLRLRDVAEMTWSAVDLDAGVIRIKTKKTSASLVLPLHEDLKEWITAQPRGIARAPVFPSLSGKGTGGRFGLSGRFKAVMDAAGIKGRVLRESGGKGRQTSSLSFHSLRHSFVSALANAGVASELRQKLSGHADDRSHATYTHHEIETFRAAVTKLPRIGK